MNVTDHTAYKKARVLASLIWSASRSWDRNIFSTLGNQLVRSSDSISANLAEGWNRYSKKDKINFYVIARASVAETQDWLDKAFERDLIDSDKRKQIDELLQGLPKDINGLIKGTKFYLSK